MSRELTDVYQKALLGEGSYILEFGPSQADAFLMIEDGKLSIMGPGVDSELTPEMMTKLRNILDAAQRFGLMEDE